MGYAIASTVLSAAADQALATRAIAKTELSLSSADPSQDAWIDGAINRVSMLIANDTNRVFAPEVVQDVIDVQQDAYPAQTSGGFRQLLLSRFPVISILSLSQATALDASTSLVEGVDWRVNKDTGELLRLNAFTGVGRSWEPLPITVRYLTGYGDRLDTVQVVPATSPYDIVVADGAGISCDVSVTDADGNALVRVTASPGDGEYSVDALTGTYHFNAAQAGVGMAVSYAVKAIPADLEDACLRLISSRFASKGRDPSLIQRDTPGVGTERFWFGGAPGQRGPFPPEIDAMLENYRMPIVA